MYLVNDKVAKRLLRSEEVLRADLASDSESDCKGGSGGSNNGSMHTCL